MLLENTIVSSDNGPKIKHAYDDGALENLNGHDPHNGLRGEKGLIYEGGLRLPFIFSWPAKVATPRADPRPVNLSNMIPTITALVGAPVPGGVWKDARDDSGILLGNDSAPDKPLYLQNGTGNIQAVRLGPWKYIRLPQNKEELYNLEKDPSETTSQTTAEPKIRAQMKALMDEFLSRKY